MEVKYRNTRVVYNNKSYYRQEFYSQGIMIWSSETGAFLNKKLRFKIEEEYQKTLIPTKTPNLSKGKGYLAKAKEYYNKFSTKQDITIFSFAKWLDANGETPEVDNPVPSLDNLAIKIMKMFGTDESHHWVKDSIIKVLKSELQNGRTTDRVEPKCLCDKGRCNVCVNYCTLTGSDSNM